MNVPYYRPTVAEINLDAMTDNILFFRNHLPKQVEIMAVVKANAYGHGVIPVVHHLQSIGIRNFAVAFIDEAIQLRKAGVVDRILILGHTPVEAIEEAFRYDIRVTVFTKDVLERINQIGEKLRKPLKVHLKIETGMGRIGVYPEDVNSYYEIIRSSPWIELEGVFTHFATADEKDKGFTRLQYQRFIEAVHLIEKFQEIPIIHISNSAAMIDLPDLPQNMVRLGISLYGMLPSDEVGIRPQQLKPVMTLKTKISFIKKVNPGQTISYGATYKVEKKSIVATIPIGYADGFPRGLSNKGYVLIHGKKAPILGRVCMDQTMVDVTEIPNVKEGDEVVIYGEQQGSVLRMDDHAKLLETINYELATSVGYRIPRVYYKNGQIIKISHYLLGR
ncbi:alanine racemase [Tepidibacillus fermentans]|uniref:Alanine racemase n=1 Tax=Tepidibacillus fermentans TaxID=1281767 RepID=A0A4R3K988_9BACI|nr:alanine racemase [Tepidibacillus fermentans]TCS79584.1 alanine racemase [Tepidibacillus fermentans]